MQVRYHSRDTVSFASNSILSDIAFGDSGVRRGIVDALSAAYPGVYTNENIALVGTHSHSGVGGYFEVPLSSQPHVNLAHEPTPMTCRTCCRS